MKFQYGRLVHSDNKRKAFGNEIRLRRFITVAPLLWQTTYLQTWLFPCLMSHLVRKVHVLRSLFVEWHLNYGNWPRSSGDHSGDRYLPPPPTHTHTECVTSQTPMGCRLKHHCIPILPHACPHLSPGSGVKWG